MTDMKKWVRNLIKMFDDDKDGVLNAKTELIPILYTFFVGYMIYKEANDPVELFSDFKFLAIVGGSLGIEFVRALADIYICKFKRNEKPDNHYDNPIS